MLLARSSFAIAIVVLGVGSATAPAFAQSSQARAVVAQAVASPAPRATEDPKMAALAASLVTQAQNGKIDAALFDAKMNSLLTPQTLEPIKTQLAPLGAPTKFTLLASGVRDGYRSYAYHVVWPSTSFEELFALDADGKIAGWFIRPSTPASPAPDTGAASPAPAASPATKL